METVLRVEDLTIGSVSGGSETKIVSGVSFSLKAGQVIGLIGESGSGKTTIGLSSLGFFKPGLRARGGRVMLGDTDLLKLNEPKLRALRGKEVAYVAQSAAAAFNPCIVIDEQVIEPLTEHGLAEGQAAHDIATGLYRDLDLPNPEQIGTRFPHEVSGGQLQRLMAAMAMGTGPKLIVFDEPTTALDVTTQVQVLQAFKRLIRDHRAASIYISHDLAVVAQVADYVIVLRNGAIVEAGETADILSNPQSAYTKDLLRASGADAAGDARIMPADHNHGSGESRADIVLAGRNLVAGYGRAGSAVVKAVDNVSFELKRGEVLGVIGESGSGKSTLARVIAGLLPAVSGDVALAGKLLPAALEKRSFDQLKRIQIVFQSADTALNPKHTIGKILGRVAAQLSGASAAAARQAAREALELVQLPAAFEHRYPQQLSGGQKQRVNLARALIAKPDVVICDEVTSALDPLIREQIVELLRDLKARLGLSMIFISHDISTISALADDVIVMLKGEPVEQGAIETVLKNPEHPYTRTLISSVPRLEMGWLENHVRATSHAVPM